MKKVFIVIWVAGLLTSCTDDLLPSASGEMDDADCIAFAVNVVEQADMIYDYGRTRAAAGEPALDSATIAANTFGAHAMEGDNPWGMNIHRMPLPFVGIHPGSASTDEEQLTTRAPLSEIAGNDLLFHDSLTIWGCVYKVIEGDNNDYHRFLFNQTLLKKVRGWRSSVHWPYDDGQGDKMRFCAISPAFENLDITLVTPPKYEEGGTLTPPTFRYNVPENPGEQRDLLFGCAGADPAISVTDGPTPGYGGSGTGYYEDEASTEKQQHLGQDDKVINISFQHILTAVRFAQGKMPVGVTIKRITLAHIKSQGVYDPGQEKWGNMTGNPLTWSDNLPDKYSTYTIYPNKNITSYEENVYIDGDSVLFLMPQTLVEGAELQIVLTEASAPTVERTLKCSLKDDVWKMGYTVTYKVTIGELKGEYYLVLDTGTDEVTIPKHGDTGTETKYSNGAATHETSTSTTSGSFIIHSFRNAKDYSTSSSGTNKHQKADWKMTGFSWTKDGTYEAKNCPAWITSIDGWNVSSTSVGTTQGEKTPTGETYSDQGYQTVSYTLAPQARAYFANHSSVLNASSGNPSVSGFDLSLKQPNGTTDGLNKTQETANCYIVNAEGTYKFPAVYGNGITGGSVKDLSGNTLFLDHRGKPIKYANIYKQINSYTEELQREEDYVTYKNNSDATDIITKEAYDVLDASSKTNYTLYTQKKRTYTTVSYDKITGGLSQELIWQDARELFKVETTTSSDSYNAFDKTNDNGHGYVEFQVLGHTPGNCVIALKGRRTTVTRTCTYSDTDCNTLVSETSSTTTAAAEDAEVLWTWHIWMTDEVYPNKQDYMVNSVGITNDDSNGEEQKNKLKKQIDQIYPSYFDDTDDDKVNGSKIVKLLNADGSDSGKRLLPVNLGWVPDDDEFGIYQPRETWVEIVQPVTDVDEADWNRIHICIRQEAKQECITGTSTMYQWGRPTALPMVNKISGTERTIYGATGSTSITNHFEEEKVGPASIMAAVIGHPKKLIRNNADGNFWWPDALAHAYWGETKTLYDPCPPGFQMPPSSVFGWMTKDDMENNIGTAFLNTLNMWDGELGGNMGGYFYAKKHETLPVPPSDRYLQKFYFPATSYYNKKPSESSTLLKDWFADYKQHGICWTYLQGRIIDFNTSSSGVKLDDDLIVNLHAIRPVSQ